MDELIESKIVEKLETLNTILNSEFKLRSCQGISEVRDHSTKENWIRISFTGNLIEVSNAVNNFLKGVIVAQTHKV